MIWVTVLFTIFIIGLIVLADMGKMRFLLWLLSRFPYGDKIVHFGLIGGLSFLLNTTAMQLLPKQNPRRVSLIVTLFLLVVFTLEEISQGPIRGRDASLSDLAANYAGIITFALLAYLTRKKTQDTLSVKSVD